jgi:hypothetical protein
MGGYDLDFFKQPEPVSGIAWQEAPRRYRPLRHRSRDLGDEPTRELTSPGAIRERFSRGCHPFPRMGNAG